MQHELLFINPVFHKGINVTVRNGDKWMKAGVNDEVVIKKTGNDQVIYTATVVGKAYIPFKLISDEWLMKEHDPNCQNREGLLLYGMKPAYPNFTEDNYVTVLFFNI